MFFSGGCLMYCLCANDPLTHHPGYSRGNYSVTCTRWFPPGYITVLLSEPAHSFYLFIQFISCPPPVPASSCADRQGGSGGPAGRLHDHYSGERAPSIAGQSGRRGPGEGSQPLPPSGGGLRQLHFSGHGGHGRVCGPQERQRPPEQDRRVQSRARLQRCRQASRS